MERKIRRARIGFFLIFIESLFIETGIAVDSVEISPRVSLDSNKVSTLSGKIQAHK